MYFEDFPPLFIVYINNITLFSHREDTSLGQLRRT